MMLLEELGDLYISTCFFQLICNFFSFCFRNTFFDVLGCTINQVFCFFQTETSQVFNDLHYVEFRSTTALQHYVECSLFFSSSCATAFATTCHNYCCSC